MLLACELSASPVLSTCLLHYDKLSVAGQGFTLQPPASSPVWLSVAGLGFAAPSQQSGAGVSGWAGLCFA